MPTYEYQCDACAHQFEEMQSFSDDALTKCPKCKKKKLRRLFGTGAAVLFKGAGFYQTDYRSESYKSAEKKDSEGAKPAPASIKPITAASRTSRRKRRILKGPSPQHQVMAQRPNLTTESRQNQPSRQKRQVRPKPPNNVTGKRRYASKFGVRSADEGDALPDMRSGNPGGRG
jgi:putative FmdB family regulatory protein